MKILSVLIAIIAPPLGAQTIPFIGTQACETSGDGFAFDIPNLDGTTVNADGSVNYNSVTYPPLPFDPQNPEAPVAPGTAFNFGSITYDAGGITGTGRETLAVTPGMFVFDFSTYDLAFGYELDVRPPTLGKSVVTLEAITGPGLTFENGVVKRLDFAAKVVWWPTLGGSFKQTFTPYTGTLKVVNGKFTFALSDAPARWVLGTGDVFFTFDLIATVPALSTPVPPNLAISQSGPGNVLLTMTPEPSSSGTFILQESGSLSRWDDLGTAFDAGFPPAPVLLPITPPTRFFRLRNISP